MSTADAERRMEKLTAEVRELRTTVAGDRMEPLIAEVRNLRTSLPPMPDTHASPADLHDYLLDVRRRMDRVEHIVGLVARIRAALKRRATAAHEEAEDAWDAAITLQRNQPVRRAAEEYSSARERAAEANLAILPIRRAARDAATDLAYADEAHDLVRLVHRGLDGVRHDTLTVLRLVQFESSMER